MHPEGFGRSFIVFLSGDLMNAHLGPQRGAGCCVNALLYTFRYWMFLKCWWLLLIELQWDFHGFPIHLEQSLHLLFSPSVVPSHMEKPLANHRNVGGSPGCMPTNSHPICCREFVPADRGEAATKAFEKFIFLWKKMHTFISGWASDRSVPRKHAYQLADPKCCLQ